ncbi:MAG: response regulator [Deltaproteobacteria bacterium]|nr:response regulator [Deltaproteobacteria bacterium]
MKTTILIVEDEKDLVEILEYNLEREGYDVRSAMTGSKAFEQIHLDPLPDLVLLDLMLPDISGTEICRRIRAEEKTRDIPVLMLTAKGEEIDRVVGFEVGADDYVTKPFSVRELMLRIKAILKRGRGAGESDEKVTFGLLDVDIPGHRVIVDGEEVALTALEFKLLGTFLERKGRVQTRDVLLGDVWDIHADVTTRTVDTHVKRLREKLGSAGEYIETIRGVGYRFRSRPDQVAD